jgi:hypothetical protein
MVTVWADGEPIVNPTTARRIGHGIGRSRVNGGGHCGRASDRTPGALAMRNGAAVMPDRPSVEREPLSPDDVAYTTSLGPASARHPGRAWAIAPRWLEIGSGFEFKASALSRVTSEVSASSRSPDCTASPRSTRCRSATCSPSPPPRGRPDDLVIDLPAFERAADEQPSLLGFLEAVRHERQRHRDDPAGASLRIRSADVWALAARHRLAPQTRSVVGSSSSACSPGRPPPRPGKT